MAQQVIFTEHPAQALERLVADISPKGICIVADSNTADCVVSRLCDETEQMAQVPVIEIAPGDENKNLDTLVTVWEAMEQNALTRRSLVVNVGGGVVTDLGGFAASTFKRGVRFINLPTTLLGAVDAAVGGKTGINFRGLKNELGVFREADAVIVSAHYFSTLSPLELLSGYGEVIKHGLISSSDVLQRVLEFDINGADMNQLQAILCESVEVKRDVVRQDPYEAGLRKALNLGHTVAHAIEAWAMREGKERPPHGVAVAWGLVVDMVLSHMRLGFDTKWLNRVARYIGEYFPAPQFGCGDYPVLIELMRHDKKNADARNINFTLLRAPGEVALDNVVAPDEICAALDIARDLLGV